MTVFKEGPFIDYSTASMLNVIDGQSSRISKLKSTPAMTTDIDREKLRELCERATHYPGQAIAALKEGQTQLDQDGVFVGVSRQALDEVIAALDGTRATSATLVGLFDAQAEKIAELKASAKYTEDSLRLGLSQTELDLMVAHQRIASLESECDQLRKQVDGQFIAGMRGAVNVIKGIEIWDSPDADVRGDAFDTACDAILSAASALEQKEQG